MKVFIGWSGERSQRVAEALLGWLQRLFFPLHLVRASGPCEAKRLRGRHEEELKRRVIIHGHAAIDKTKSCGPNQGCASRGLSS
jgi:hypothetical protein